MLGSVRWIVLLWVIGCSGCLTKSELVAPSELPELEAFASEEDLQSFLRGVRTERTKAVPEESDGFGPDDAASHAATQWRPAPMAQPGKASAGEGVDEGGIVKAHGDYLLVLRRGRLFSLHLGRKLSLVSMVDVFPGDGEVASWYDEVLVAGDHIVVLGFSNEQEATELGIFSIDRAGKIAHRETRYLRSNDHGSSRNSASRLVGEQLIIYLPYALLPPRGGAVALPALGTLAGASIQWAPVLAAKHVIRPVQHTLHPVLHTVLTCELGAPGLACSARGVIGPAQRNHYVSPDAVFVWVDEDKQEPRPVDAVVYRLPLGAGDAGALRVRGSPVDQSSFKRDEAGILNVLVRGRGWRQGTWEAEAAPGPVELLRVPEAAFARKPLQATPRAYGKLPAPTRSEEPRSTTASWAITCSTGPVTGRNWPSA